MKIQTIQLIGIRAFEDTSEITLNPKVNIFVGLNNSGKSTILKSIINTQIPQFSHNDIRPFSQSSSVSIRIDRPSFINASGHEQFYMAEQIQYICHVIQGSTPHTGTHVYVAQSGQPIFASVRPTNPIVPFFSTRRSTTYSRTISLEAQEAVNGSFSDIYARIDRVSTTGRTITDRFQSYVKDVIGIPITTDYISGGKIAGYFYNDDKFIEITAMGDGITEMAGLIAELCLAKDKIFVIEEPETHLHPSALRALMRLIRESANSNQFVIATHSSIVLRELGDPSVSNIFRVYRDGPDPNSPSKVHAVSSSATERISILEELGYTFSDYDLHEAWLFLEEASAEAIVNKILIPFFAPHLAQGLRTFSSRGVTRIESSVDDFMRLITFVHLEPVYAGKIWVAVDGDPEGVKAFDKMKKTFKSFSEDKIEKFREPYFEKYYPKPFCDEIDVIMKEHDKDKIRDLKTDLLVRVLKWTSENENEARPLWEQSAKEVIDFLNKIKVPS